MFSQRIKALISVFTVFSLLVFSLACGGTREDKTSAPTNQEASNALENAYNLMAETDVLPVFMQTGESEDLSNFDTSAANELLPSPTELENDVDANGDPNYDKYEDAIDNINTAINLIGSAKKTRDYDPGIAEKTYIYFIGGYLYTVSAAARLVFSDLGKKVLTFVDFKYVVELPTGDVNNDGNANIGDINGEGGSDGLEEVKSSCQSLVNAIYLLIGRKFEIKVNDDMDPNDSNKNLVNGVRWYFTTRVDTTLTNRFPNPDPITGINSNNAVYFLTQTVIYGKDLFPGLEGLLKEVDSTVAEFDRSMKEEAEGYGFVDENE